MEKKQSKLIKSLKFLGVWIIKIIKFIWKLIFKFFCLMLVFFISSTTYNFDDLENFDETFDKK